MRTAKGTIATAAALLALSLPAWAQTLTRGPYLQQGNQNSVIVRWRTSSATNSRVRIGTTLVTPLPTIVDNASSVTEHVVSVTGLAANTKYYYSVGSTTATLAGPDANHFFVTSPAPGTAKPTRVWVLGDAGTGSTGQLSVRDAYTAFTGARHTDLWLMLGDNAYSTGTDAEYQSKLFNVYPAMLRKSVLWATIGNHEGASADSIAQTGPHYDNFTFPKNGECGGSASGTEAYYSFDYGNIHFICLESYDILTSTTAKNAMKSWVTSDAAATTREWLVAFWHHPPYSKGSHDSDTESGLITMRQEFNPVLEDAGVDLILAGHSHSYERSFFINGHYGSSGTFTNAMKVQAGGGQNPTPYTKAAGTPADSGTVYVVAGSSGQASGGSLNHPAMYVSLNNLGSLVLDVDGNRMDVTFLRENGSQPDTFAIVKGGASTPAVTITATDASAAEAAGNPGQFTVSRGTSGSTALAVNLTVGGTATNGTDYTTIPVTVTIPAGSVTATIAVTPVDDSAVEPSETVIVTVAAGTGYTVGASSSATVTIADNDTSTVTIAATDANASEAGPATGTFTITRTGGTTSTALPVTIARSGTATNVTDYAAINSPVTIPSGATSVTVTVTPVDDSAVEGNETVVLTVSAGAGDIVGGASSATVTIADNDSTTDADGDGLPDSWEIQYFTNTAAEDGAGDPDTDGLTNLQEFQRGTHPLNPDTDGDGMNDGWEVQFLLNPTSGADASGDLDGDGYSNLQEFQAGTDPSDPGSVPAAAAGGSSGGGKRHCGSTIPGGGSPGLFWIVGALALLPLVLRRA